MRPLAVRAPGKRPKTRVPILKMLIGCRAQLDAQAYQAKYAGVPFLCDLRGSSDLNGVPHARPDACHIAVQLKLIIKGEA